MLCLLILARLRVSFTLFNFLLSGRLLGRVVFTGSDLVACLVVGLVAAICGSCILLRLALASSILLLTLSLSSRISLIAVRFWTLNTTASCHVLLLLTLLVRGIFGTRSLITVIRGDLRCLGLNLKSVGLRTWLLIRGSTAVLLSVLTRHHLPLLGLSLEHLLILDVFLVLLQ